MIHIIYLGLIIMAVAQAKTKDITPSSTNPILQEILKLNSSKVFIAAHRGGYESDKQDRAPENSLPNIANSHSKGYQLFETDIQRTHDGHFIIVHDPTIERETSGTGAASALSLMEIKALHKRYRDKSLSQESVATLAEFLAAGKERTVFKADMKKGVNKHFLEIMKLVVEHEAMDGIIFRVPYRHVEFYDDYQKQGGPIAPHTLMFQVASVAQIDDIKKRFNSSTIEIVLNPKKPVTTESLALIAYASKTGFIVETHAEGDADDWIQLIQAGVRIFHTKTPSQLQKILIKHKFNHK